jgi:aminopeptidase N
MVRRLSVLVAVSITMLGGNAGPGAEPIHHEIEARIWPEAGRIEVADRIELGGATDLTVRLDPALVIESATLDGRPVQVRRLGGGWQIAADRSSASTLRLIYGGTLAAEPSEGGLFLGPEGSFLPAGSGWFATLGEGPMTFDLRVEVPSPYRAVATGDIAAESDTAAGYRARFVATHEGEGPSLFVGPYAIAEARIGTIALRTYFYEDQADLAAIYLRRAAEYLRLFEDRIGAYPYQGFSIVAAPIPVGLGFAGLTYVSRRILHLPFMQQGSLAHEILHSWWGNAVAVAYDRGNWAEGLTTYMADHALAEAAGAEQARELRLAWLRDYAALPVERDAPLREFVAKRHDAEQVIGYNKAAFVFHMLRRRVGDPAFDAAIQLFWRRQRFTTASWDEMQRAFEDAAGEDLGTFFEQWLERPGAPHLFLDRAHQEQTDRGYAVHLQLSQGEPAYALLVPVAIETEGGVERRAIELVGTSAEAVLATRARPLELAVDPDYDVFRHIVAGEAPPILRDVTLSDRALVLIAAEERDVQQIARELAARMMDHGAEQVGADDVRLGDAPLLLVGLTERVTALLKRTDLPGTQAGIAGRGSARVWTARRAGAAAMLVVEADDASALGALLRPLPHYGRSSWLVFDGNEVIDRGVWPAAESSLRRRLG